MPGHFSSWSDRDYDARPELHEQTGLPVVALAEVMPITGKDVREGAEVRPVVIDMVPR